MKTLLFALLATMAQTQVPPRARIVFELHTPGARVELVHGSDIAIAFDTSQRWSVHATKPLHPGC